MWRILFQSPKCASKAPHSPERIISDTLPPSWHNKFSLRSSHPKKDNLKDHIPMITQHSCVCACVSMCVWTHMSCVCARASARERVRMWECLENPIHWDSLKTPESILMTNFDRSLLVSPTAKGAGQQTNGAWFLLFFYFFLIAEWPRLSEVDWNGMYCCSAYVL